MAAEVGAAAVAWDSLPESWVVAEEDAFLVAAGAGVDSRQVWEALHDRIGVGDRRVVHLLQVGGGIGATQLQGGRVGLLGGHRS